MKPMLLIGLFALLFFSGVSSCIKETPPIPPLHFDSGFYDPSSYFPLKWGAQWTYENKSGSRLKVNCGAHFTDTLRQYQHKYVYQYYALSTTPIDSPFVGYGFGYNGKYRSGSRVGNMCIKGAPFAEYFMSQSGGSPGHIAASYDCGGRGPSTYTYFACLDTGLQIDGFHSVNSFCEFHWSAIQAYKTPVELDGQQAELRGLILPNTTSQLSFDYYAKGIGLVRKELIDHDGKVVDWIKLVAYSIPQ